MVLVGNKSDMEKRRVVLPFILQPSKLAITLNLCRCVQVKKTDGEALAKAFGVPFMETSAKV